MGHLRKAVQQRVGGEAQRKSLVAIEAATGMSG